MSIRTESKGFTLLEVLVALAILAIAASVTLSLISGSMRNIRKVQLKTRAIELAESEMEKALLDPSVTGPTSQTGSLPDGTRWIVKVEDYTELDDAKLAGSMNPLPVKLLSYTVEVSEPQSSAPDYRVQTLKLVRSQTTTGGLQ